MDVASGHSDLGVVRLTAAGVPDAGFGIGGLVTVRVGAGPVDQAAGLALQPDGRILFAADVRFAHGDSDFGVVRLDGDGAADVPVGGDFDGDGMIDPAVYGFSPLDRFPRFVVLPLGGSPTRTERFGEAGAVARPPFAGLNRVEGAGADGVSSRGATAKPAGGRPRIPGDVVG